MKRNPPNMRVLLLAAFVASTYAASHRGVATPAFGGTADWVDEWEKQQLAATTAGSATPTLALPAGLKAAADTYDAAIQVDKAAFFAALAKTPADFTTAKGAFAKSIVACGIYDALFTSSWKTTATPAALKTRNEAVIKELILADHAKTDNVGACNTNATPAVAIADLANKGSAACKAKAATNVWVAGTTAEKDAWATTTAAAAHTNSNLGGKTCAEQFAFPATGYPFGAKATSAVFQGRDLTAAELYGFGPPTTTAKPSAKSPASALAVGVAAILAFLL